MRDVLLQAFELFTIAIVFSLAPAVILLETSRYLYQTLLTMKDQQKCLKRIRRIVTLCRAF